MLNKIFWRKILSEQAELDGARRQIINQSLDALHISKQGIFALHRDNVKEADEKLARAEQLLLALEKKFGRAVRLKGEGAWKAAREEFVEAKLFQGFMTNGKIASVGVLKIEADEYIGGLSDLCGEIVRKMIDWATRRDLAKVYEGYKVIGDIIHELMQNNLTGYLRTKFDQAKKHWQKAGSIIYDLSLTQGK